MEHISGSAKGPSGEAAVGIASSSLAQNKHFIMVNANDRPKTLEETSNIA